MLLVQPWGAGKWAVWWHVNGMCLKQETLQTATTQPKGGRLCSWKPYGSLFCF